ncbi:MAG: efflux RND transporter periplasmic adaptor subunit [Prevotella sp.]|nr:efflux RND transporter periplasmic adaptor subunit [Prevotella sp.]
MKEKQIMALMVLVLLFSACSKKKESEPKAPTLVKTELVTAGGSMGEQSYVGIVEENEATAVSFTGMGVVKRVLVREGQAVGRGQLLAVMDDSQARNVLAGAEAQMAQAEDALKRYGMLHDAGSLPEAQWVEIQSKVAQARSQLAVAKKNLADCQLKAPVSGIIGRQQVKAGETAMPSQAVVTIMDVTRVKVRVSVPEAEMNAITPHTPSMVIVEAAGKKLNGGRIEKGVVADPMTHTYDIRISVPNSDRKLLPGMVAEVRMRTQKTTTPKPTPALPRGGSLDTPSDSGTTSITPDTKANQSPLPSVGEGGGFYLPITSVQRRPDGSLFVWTVDNQKKAHRTAVTVGASQGNRISILSGVTAGQRVVTEGYQKLSEGTEVRF